MSLVISKSTSKRMYASARDRSMWRVSVRAGVEPLHEREPLELRARDDVFADRIACLDCRQPFELFERETSFAQLRHAARLQHVEPLPIAATGSMPQRRGAATSDIAGACL